MSAIYKLCLTVSILSAAVSCKSFRTIEGFPLNSDIEAKVQVLEDLKAGKIPDAAKDVLKDINTSAPASEPADSKEVSNEIKVENGGPVTVVSNGSTTAEVSVKTQPAATPKAATASKPAATTSKPSSAASASAVADSKPAPAATSKPAAAKTVSSANGRYEVVIGAFSMSENADKLLKTAKDRGYDAGLEQLGLQTAVYLSCPSSDRASAEEFLEKVKKEDFCPNDAWLRSR